MHNTPFYTQQWSSDDYYEWCDNAPEPEEPEETVVCSCDNCEEDIHDCDEMVVVEERLSTGECKIKRICMDCWEANKWDKAEELLDMLGIWYWSGDAVEAMQIAGEHLLKEKTRYKRMLGTAVNTLVSAVTGKENA